MSIKQFVLELIAFMAVIQQASGHGRLVEPPSRASAWRFGFNTPKNWNDNELFCGGMQNQWGHNGGKCGVCGDPFQGPRPHEAPGRFATGTIVRRYPVGGVIEITVDLTANHLGWFEFRLCPHNNPEVPVSQSCLDRYLLSQVDGRGTRMPIEAGMKMVTEMYRLPEGVTCSQCIVQWKYNTGNSWGVDPDSGAGCIGCGPQEQFYGCADIAIGDWQSPSSDRPSSLQPQPSPSSSSGPQTRTPAMSTTTTTTSPPPTRPPIDSCRAIGEFANRLGYHKWCRDNCSRGYCPSHICKCD